MFVSSLSSTIFTYSTVSLKVDRAEPERHIPHSCPNQAVSLPRMQLKKQPFSSEFQGVLVVTNVVLSQMCHAKMRRTRRRSSSEFTSFQLQTLQACHPHDSVTSLWSLIRLPCCSLWGHKTLYNLSHICSSTPNTYKHTPRLKSMNFPLTNSLRCISGGVMLQVPLKHKIQSQLLMVAIISFFQGCNELNCCAHVTK